MSSKDFIRYWKTKKPCSICGFLIKRTSNICLKCNGINKRTSYIQKRNVINLWNKDKLNYYKNLVFEKLGSSCKLCGFSDKRALHVDHINENGNIERKLSRPSKNYIKYKRVYEDKNNQYQILCANCNMIKSYNRMVHGVNNLCLAKNNNQSKN